MAFNYYGVDWIACVFTFVAIYLLGNKARAGFVIMMCGNSCWVIVGLLTHSNAMVIANAVFFAMNLRGFMRWAASEPTSNDRVKNPTISSLAWLQEFPYSGSLFLQYLSLEA